MSERTPYDGKPYYCRMCDLGLGEFLACEDTVCRLEGHTTALARKAIYERGKADGAAEEREAYECVLLAVINRHMNRIKECDRLGHWNEKLQEKGAVHAVTEALEAIRART